MASDFKSNFEVVNDFKKEKNQNLVKKIYKEIKGAKKILLAIHVSPDLDGITSVLAMEKILRRMGKKTRIISFSQIPSRLQFFPGTEKIETKDFAKINFGDFDLFISLDSAQERMITRSPYPKKFPPSFKVVNIDHHLTNTRFGDINLVSLVSSTTEILYQLLKIWEMKIDRALARLLFYGIFADSGCFQYSSTSAETFRIAADLIEKGASLPEAVLHSFRSYNLKTLKYWGRVLDNMQIDVRGKFIWSKISKAEREELGVEVTEVEGAANLFAPIVSGTEFGIILIEESDGLVRGSLRSREAFDVSKIAVKLGGGGHKAAAGFSLNMSLEEAEKKILEVARKYLTNK